MDKKIKRMRTKLKNNNTWQIRIEKKKIIKTKKNKVEI